MAMQFRKAERRRGRLRVGLAAPSGGGKSVTMLQMLEAFAQRAGGRFACIDTEAGSLELYCADDRHPADGVNFFDFDVLNLEPPFTPARYREAIAAAKEAGYPALGIDSLSHAWVGEGGALEMVDDATKRLKGNKFAAWGDVTPEHHKLIESMIRYPGHLVATMRSKVEYVQEGKTVRKVGMAPVQRDGMEYEFTVVADIDVDHNWLTSKTRCSELDLAVFNLVTERSGQKVAGILLDWIEGGAAPADVFEARAKTAGVTDDEIAAFAKLHPKLPDDVDSWSDPHYEEAIRILESLGRAKFTAALTALETAQ